MRVLAVLDMPAESKAMTEQIDRLAGKAITITGWLRLGRSEVVMSLRHYLAGTKPRTSHHRSRGGERERYA